MRWLFSGDSITQGAVHTRGWRDYTQLFRERLSELARNEDVVINTAVGGWSVASLLPRLDERILHWRPDVVFLMYGTNDAVRGSAGTPTFEATYLEVADRILQTGTVLVIQTTIPMHPVDPAKYIDMGDWADLDLKKRKLDGLAKRLQHLDRYVAATRRVVSDLPVHFVDHWEVWRRIGASRSQLVDGGFHPNEYGHRLIARTLLRRLGMWDADSWVGRGFIPVR